MKAVALLLALACAACAPEEPFTPGVPPSMTLAPDAGPDAGESDAGDVDAEVD